MIKIPNLFHKYENSIRTFTLALLLLLVVSGCTDQAVEGRPAKIVEADLTATTSSSDNATSQPATPAATKTPISTQVVSNTSSTAIPATAANTATTTTTPTSVPTATTVVPTTTPTPVPVPTPTEILTPVPTPIEILTPVPTPTATPTQVPTPTATPTPTETPTPTVTSTPTTVPSPTPTIIVATNPTPTITPPTPTPAPTSTPVPIPDDRYGVIASGPGLAWQLETLGTDWFIDYKADPRGAPAGTNRVPYIGVKPGTVRIAPELLAEYAAGVPGSYWYIGGETNVPAQNGIEPASYVVEFDYYRQLILAADPTAKFLGPSVLNWDFTCTGCGGYMTGHVWMSDFVDAYAAAHSGESPPIDAWAIDAYPLTWSATPEYPNPLPMVEWQIVADQAIGLRDFLKTVPGHADTPIWITEVASHWAYDEVGWVNSNLAIPETPYRWDLMSEYIANLVTWLQSNGPTLKIDRWFLYRGYINIADHAKSGYAGIYLFESGDTGAALTPAGEVYRDFASGIGP